MYIYIYIYTFKKVNSNFKLVLFHLNGTLRQCFSHVKVGLGVTAIKKVSSDLQKWSLTIICSFVSSKLNLIVLSEFELQ